MMTLLPKSASTGAVDFEREQCKRGLIKEGHPARPVHIQPGGIWKADMLNPSSNTDIGIPKQLSERS